MLILKNSSHLHTKHKEIEDLQKSAGCHSNSIVNDKTKIKDILDCTLYCVITQINITSDQTFVLYSPFMIRLNTTWGCQLPPGCHMSIRHCATCTYMYIFGLHLILEI